MLFCKSKNIPITISLTLFIILSAGCRGRYEDLNLSIYQYRDTKNLVRFVYDASLRLKKDGLKSIEYFKHNREKYNTKDYYLYIYDMNGKNLFHAGMKELEGKNLGNILDKNGKNITKLILSAIDDRNNPHGWVHYTWWEPGKFYPVPKSSCNFKVKTPEGEEVFVGAGLSYPHEEKEFIRIVVDDAAELIAEYGETAIDLISDPTSQYNYRDVRVFAFTENGKTLISPVVNDSIAHIKILDCTDEVGNKPFKNALKKLQTKESTWEIFMAKSRYERTLIKKCLYLRKTQLKGITVYVGAITDLPQPSWM